MNHLCERCKRCSDCCVCEVRLINHHEIGRHEPNGKVRPELPVEQPEPAPDLREHAPAPDELDEG